EDEGVSRNRRGRVLRRGRGPGEDQGGAMSAHRRAGGERRRDGLSPTARTFDLPAFRPPPPRGVEWQPDVFTPRPHPPSGQRYRVAAAALGDCSGAEGASCERERYWLPDGRDLVASLQSLERYTHVANASVGRRVGRFRRPDDG